MFEDVCLVCGRLADGLYCSDACRDTDAVQLKPSSIDLAIDLGFITDSIPPLVSSARPSRQPNPDDPSTVSSPTSSILTTPSVVDDLDSDYLTPTTLTAPTKALHDTSIDAAAKLLTPAHPTSSQIRSPRLQPVVTQPPQTLPFIRKPGHTNIHLPPPNTAMHHQSSGTHSHSRASAHRRTASFNVASTSQSRASVSPIPPLDQAHPNGQSSNPGPHAPSRAHRGHHQRTTHSAGNSNSGNDSPAVFSDHDLPPLHELALEAPAHPPRHHRQPSREQASSSGGEKEKTRKKRSRQSLPAYFSNLVMGPVTTSSSKVPSTAVSSGTPSPDGPRIRHMRSKSAIRATSRSRNPSAIKLSTSASTYKQHPAHHHGNPTSALSTRSNSGASLTIRVKQKVPSPTTPTTCHLLKTGAGATAAAGAANVRGREREKARGRSRGILAPEAVVYPVTATRHSPTATEEASSTSPVASFAEKHIRFIQGSGGSSVKRLSGFLRHHFKSPPPASRAMDVAGPLSAGILEGESPFSSSYTHLLLQGRGTAAIMQTSPTKTRRYSSPATGTVPVPISLMMSPALPRDATSPRLPAARRGSSPRLVPMVRRGWSPVRGRGAVFADEEDEDADESEEEEEEEEEEEVQEEEAPRGRSRSRLRSRSRARSRSHERERRMASQRAW